MNDIQKRWLLVGAVVIAGGAAIWSFYNSGVMGEKIEVVGTLPQASKQEEMDAANRAAQNAAPPATDAVRTGQDPADVEGSRKGKG